MTPVPHSMLAIKITAFPCNMEFVRWRRRHRKRRIDNKWRKKYGAVQRCKNVTVRAGNTIFTCQCVLAKIAQTVPAT